MTIWDRTFTGIKGGRKRSPRAKPRALEHKIQSSVCDYLDIAKRPEIHYFAIPNQSNRHIQNAAKMKAEGVRAGSPDICVMLPAGRVGWLEMKSETGSLSSAQKTFRHCAERLGHYWAMARSVDEAYGVFKAWGALKDNAPVPGAVWTRARAEEVA